LKQLPTAILFAVELAVAGLLIGFPDAAGAVSNRDAAARMMETIAYLSMPELAGRDAPGPMADSVARWLEVQFAGIDLKPAFAGSYLQDVPLVSARFDTANGARLAYESRAGWQELRWGDDFFVAPRRIADVSLISTTRLCGFGIVMPEIGRNDFDGLQSGEAAVVHDGADLPKEHVGMKANPAYKAAAAQRAGAAMLIVLVDEQAEPLRERLDLRDRFKDLGKTLYDLPNATPDFPVVYVRNDDFRKALWAVPTVDDNLGADTILRVREDGFSALPTRIQFDLMFKETAIASSANIAGLIGDGKEVVVVGAHYDHLGPEGSTYYPGADDNASGIAVLLEAARRIALSAPPAGCGILFVAFTCEEDGLLGSTHFVRQLESQGRKLRAMVNLDMVGRRGFAAMSDAGKDPSAAPFGFLAAYYSSHSPELGEELKSSAREVAGLYPEIKPTDAFRHFGDAAPFHAARIPTLHIFSGFHSDYHRTTDTPDRIDPDKLLLGADWLKILLHRLADREIAPVFAPSGAASTGSKRP